MIEKALINLTAMEFSEIKSNLKNFLKSQSEFTDYNFEGSGLNILIDLLAYNSQNNAYLANMIANESELDSAILRSNVVSRAKLLGYTPKSSTAARAVLSITIDDPTSESASLLLPRGTRFVVRAGSQQFTFVTLEDNNLPLTDGGVYRNDEVEVFEGTIKTFSYVATEDRRFVLPSKKIDVSTLKVVVFDNYAYNANEIFTRAFGVNKIDSNSAVFWVYETDNGNFEVKFGDGTFGKKPKTNGIVYFEYLETNGPIANDFSQFALIGSFSGYEQADITIVTINSTSGGADPEQTSSIKLNAPRFFQSQNRAVTKEDFISVTTDVYPYAKSVAVWGGEEIYPPKYGQVFISIIPESISKLTTTNKRNLERKIRAKSVVGINPKIIDPKFIKLNLTVFVDIRRTYVNGLSNFSKELKDLVKDYFKNEFGIFNSDFYYSNLLAKVKNFSRAVVGARADYTLSLISDLSQTEFKFENAIEPGSVRTSKIRVTGELEYDNVTDKDGVLISNSKTIGYVDYENGVVTLIPNMIQSSVDGSLEVFMTPANDDIVSGFASAIILDETRVAVELRVV